MREKLLIRRGLILIVGVVVIGALVLLNFNTIQFAASLAMSEKRPKLLRDAEWNAPETAMRFKDKFSPGTPEEDLVSWLATHGFAVDRNNHQAIRHIAGLPCHETVRVVWAVERSNRLQHASATIGEAGCL